MDGLSINPHFGLPSSNGFSFNNGFGGAMANDVMCMARLMATPYCPRKNNRSIKRDLARIALKIMALIIPQHTNETFIDDAQTKMRSELVVG